MSNLTMTKDEREAFLADLHVGVISIEQEGAPPLSVPIWYDYSPDVGVWLLTGANSVKGKLLEKAGRFTLVAQNEAPLNYQYVSVEGPIVETRRSEIERDRRPMARRYFGEKLGDDYVRATAEENSVVIVMRPERWRTVDYGKLSTLG
jgi:nitroimidazol reductase NimA-like FMN-containing flavoprotein (pyridoxamine 5'-phosphate oxidase superfamily)